MSERQVRIGIQGAGGRMGLALIRAVAEEPRAALCAAVERPGSDLIGKDAGQVAGLEAAGTNITDDAEALFACDVVIDFTAPAATVALAGKAAEHGFAHIIGTTGLSATDMDALRKAGQKTVVMQSGNMSLGVILLSVLVEQAARALSAGDWDLEVLEMHHKHKVDAPSGTALLLGHAAAAGRGIDLDTMSVRVRDGHTGPRETGTIGFATLRGGSVVGDHSVIMAGPGERLNLSHHAEDRSIFARGAIHAALWAHGRKQAPGLYSMRDVLGV